MKKLLSIVLGIVLYITLAAVAEAKPSGFVAVDVYNPYGMKVSIRLKCDWSNKKRKFLYNQLFNLPPKSVVRMNIPKTVRKCQIWPTASLF